jgi:hypothetical protein
MGAVLAQPMISIFTLSISESGLKQILSIIESSVGKKEADAGRKVLSNIIAARNR